MAERRRPPRATAPFFVAGGDNDFYGSTAEDDMGAHSDSEIVPSASSHSHGRPGMTTFASAADIYRTVPQSSPESNQAQSPEAAYPPSPNQTPATGRPFLAPNTAPSGYTPSPSNSRPNSYRFSYAANNNPRAFPPSAFVDPAAGVPLGPNGQPIYPDQSPPPSTTGHGGSPFYHRMSTDETGVYRTLNAGNRSSSMTSFAPPPAPWMRSELDSSRVSMASTGGRGTMTPRKRPPHPSALLKGPIEKPWLDKKDPWATASWWITVGLFFLGVAGSVILIFFGVWNTPKLGRICQVMHDDFNSLDTGLWQLESELGGFGNGEFEMTTQEPKNAYTDGGKLYIVPTLTEDEIGDQVYDGGKYTLDKCTTNNRTACTATSSEARKRVINPVQTARMNTKDVATIGYGRVEIRARMPKGDWLRPAIWMLPQDNTYGPFPMSGGIDIVTSRGNSQEYPRGGRNFVAGGLSWGPATNMNQQFRTNGWRKMRRSDFTEGYHTYVLEWSPDFLWIYVDRRVDRMLDLRFNKQSFFQRGKFPKTVLNGTTEVVLENPWEGRSNSAPFDQQFYLILSLAVGGTSGWFPDDVGSKPWFDGSATAMYDFAHAKDQWYSTWPKDEKARALAVDYVTMWKLGSC